GDGRADRQLAGLDVGLILSDYLVGHALIGLAVGDIDGSTEDHLAGVAMVVTSITTACCRRPSISRIRASTMPCCSRAAWYSAFSLRSPSSRASPMSWLSLGRTTLVRCASSSSRARAPWTV